MPTYNAGEASLAIVPDARGFKQKLEADLKRINAEYAVKITADLAKARADLDKFRAEQEAKPVKLRAEVDRDHLRRSLQSVQSDFEKLGGSLGKALKIDLASTGVALLPSLATGLVSVAQAMQQVAQAGLAVPGILAGLGASVGTLALGVHGVKDAWTAAGKAATGSAADQQKAAEAMAKLAPNAREFVQSMIDLKPAFKDLQSGVQQNLFAGMSQSLKTLVASDLPNLKKGLGGIATAINHDLLQLGSSLGSDSSKGLLDRILGNTGDADERLKRAIDPIIHAVGTLSAAGSDTLPRLADAVGNVADRFDKFITAADKDGRLSKWISDGLTGMTHLGEIALHLGESFTGITNALGGGGGLLAALDRGTGKLSAFLNSAQGQQQLTRFFQEGRDEFHKWEPIIENIGKTLPALFQAAKDTSEQFRPIIKDITDTLAQNPEVVRRIAEGFLLWKTVVQPIVAVGDAVKGVSVAFGLVGPAATTAMAEVETASAGALAGSLGKIAALLKSLGGPAAAAIIASEVTGPADQWVADHVPGGHWLETHTPATAGKAAREWWDRNVGGQPSTTPPISNNPPVPGAPPLPGYDARQGGPNSLAPFDIPGHAAGGPTRDSGGGYPAIVHPGEYIISARGRSKVPDSFLHALNEGTLPHFADGGPGDKTVNPADVGPPQVAPSPMGGGGGMLNNVLGGIASGLGGPIGNLISLGQSAGSGKFDMSAAGGLWGLAASSGDPDKMKAWESRTAAWAGNFAGKTLMSAGQIGLQGILGATGLGGSILSPSNVYNQAIQGVAGFYTGDTSPFASKPAAGGGGDDDAALAAAKAIQGIAGMPGMSHSDGTLTDAGQRAIQYAQAHAVGQKYAYGGVGPNYDCSGIASAVYAAAKGLPEGTRYFTTESDFAALGFLPGYAKGDLNIGVSRGGGGMNSHMVLTLPNGVNVESGGAHNTTVYGGTAKGALDLPLHWHLPLGGNQAVGSVPGLYDDGGPLPTGLSLAMNNTGRQEQVYTAQQHAQAQQALQATAQHAAAQPTPAVPGVSADAQHLQQQPPSAPTQPVPIPGGAAPAPAPAAVGAAISPSLAAPSVAAPPSSLDHNLKAIDTAIDSTAATLGAWGGMAASMGLGAMGGGAAAFGIEGLAKQGGKIAKNVVNVGSSFLVGNVTPGTQDLAYGSTLRSPQNVPNTAPTRLQNNTFNGMDIPKVFQELDLRDAQDHQAALAHHGRISA